MPIDRRSAVFKGAVTGDRASVGGLSRRAGAGSARSGTGGACVAGSSRKDAPEENEAGRMLFAIRAGQAGRGPQRDAAVRR